MQMQIELCIELGIPVRDMDLMDVYLTAGRIIQDEVLRQKALKYMNPELAFLPAGARKQAIEDMTPIERKELQERVLGVLPMRRKP
jgi:hypothetical protein